jgi:hypothetical protein
MEVKDSSELGYKVTVTAKPEGATGFFLESPVTVLGGKGLKWLGFSVA